MLDMGTKVTKNQTSPKKDMRKRPLALYIKNPTTAKINKDIIVLGWNNPVENGILFSMWIFVGTNKSPISLTKDSAVVHNLGYSESGTLESGLEKFKIVNLNSI
jgi:hypothetical protein